MRVELREDNLVSLPLRKEQKEERARGEKQLTVQEGGYWAVTRLLTLSKGTPACRYHRLPNVEGLLLAS